MKNEISDILKDIEEATVSNVDISKMKYKHHIISSVEPYMSESDYTALKNDIKLVGRVYRPVVIYQNKILDGRHRQRACIELGFSMPIVTLTKEYNTSSLKEAVRSIHMNRNKTKIQKDIQAFKLKQTVANITWSDAANRYGTKERSVKSINVLYNLLAKDGYERDFDKVMSRFELGMTIQPKDFEWVSKHTSTFSGAVKQFKAFTELVQDGDGLIDITEINPETGEFLKKEDNPFIETVEGINYKTEYEKLLEKYQNLEAKLKTKEIKCQH